MVIKDIKSRELFDSRGNPTLEVDVILENGIIGRSIVPSGASKGLKEALELRDNDDRLNGKGVLKAVWNVNNIIKPVLIGMDVAKQKEIDSVLIKLDGTYNKSKLGSNTILGVSMSVLKAAAYSKNKSVYEYLKGTNLPTFLMNVINGGMHASNNLSFQEFLIIPNAETFKEKVVMACEVFYSLKAILQEKGLSTAVGDEGGFAPQLKNNEAALNLVMQAIKRANYVPGKDIFLGLDIAANSLYREGKYDIDGRELTTSDLIKYYQILIFKYPIISLEDPFYEQDVDGFKRLTKLLGNKIQIVGDDLFVTNTKYLNRGIKDHLCNAILIKPNQVGTITEMINTVQLAKKYKYQPIISHRSGETEDTIIADLAVGLNIGQIKCGSISRSERVAKYNQLIRIEEELKSI